MSRIATSEQPFTYYTVSHVWGNHEPMNFGELCLEIDSSNKYRAILQVCGSSTPVWWDVASIDQSSVEEIQLAFYNMHDIYSNAVSCVIPLEYNDYERFADILQVIIDMTEKLKEFKEVVELVVADGTYSLNQATVFDDEPGIDFGLLLFILKINVIANETWSMTNTFVDFEKQYYDSEYHSRAWTYLEWWLSERKIIVGYDNDSVYPAFYVNNLLSEAMDMVNWYKSIEDRITSRFKDQSKIFRLEHFVKNFFSHMCETKKPQPLLEECEKAGNFFALMMYHLKKYATGRVATYDRDVLASWAAFHRLKYEYDENDDYEKTWSKLFDRYILGQYPGGTLFLQGNGSSAYTMFDIRSQFGRNVLSSYVGCTLVGEIIIKGRNQFNLGRDFENQYLLDWILNDVYNNCQQLAFVNDISKSLLRAVTVIRNCNISIFVNVVKRDLNQLFTIICLGTQKTFGVSNTTIYDCTDSAQLTSISRSHEKVYGFIVFSDHHLTSILSSKSKFLVSTLDNTNFDTHGTQQLFLKESERTYHLGRIWMTLDNKRSYNTIENFVEAIHTLKTQNYGNIFPTILSPIYKCFWPGSNVELITIEGSMK
ncbi:hypothetical protein HK096_000433 [Nowakowskiella sp. JEL0078]|nr:hypothetical protein HK096_000433 [Nowakowskiella sp. JEL0078]